MSVTWPLDSTAYSNSTLGKHVISKGSVTASLNYSAKVILAGEIHLSNTRRLGDNPRHFWPWKDGEALVPLPHLDDGRMARRSCFAHILMMWPFEACLRLDRHARTTDAERGRVAAL